MGTWLSCHIMSFSFHKVGLEFAIHRRKALNLRFPYLYQTVPTLSGCCSAVPGAATQHPVCLVSRLAFILGLKNNMTPFRITESTLDSHVALL